MVKVTKLGAIGYYLPWWGCHHGRKGEAETCVDEWREREIQGTWRGAWAVWRDMGYTEGLGEGRKV